jgi:hypothetical protein
MQLSCPTMTRPNTAIMAAMVPAHTRYKYAHTVSHGDAVQSFSAATWLWRWPAAKARAAQLTRQAPGHVPLTLPSTRQSWRSVLAHPCRHSRTTTARVQRVHAGARQVASVHQARGLGGGVLWCACASWRRADLLLLGSPQPVEPTAATGWLFRAARSSSLRV